MRGELINKILLSTIIVLLTVGCAGRQQPQANEQTDQVQASEIDPYEDFNRSVYKFNTQLDKYLLKPLAKTYANITPDPVESGISKFFSNLNEPRNTVNSLLQGKFDKAGLSAGRFVLNTTVGVLGFFDVAGKLDIPKHNEDFGQTLAAWGVPSGPYFVIPVFGPRYLRHSVGMIPDAVVGPTYSISDDSVRWGLTALNIVQSRAQFLGTDDLLELQLDPYIFVRETYLQKREAALNDSEVNNADEFEDEFDDEFEDELESES